VILNETQKIYTQGTRREGKGQLTTRKTINPFRLIASKMIGAEMAVGGGGSEVGELEEEAERVATR